MKSITMMMMAIFRVADLEGCRVCQPSKPKADATKPMYSRTLHPDDARDIEDIDEEEEE